MSEIELRDSILRHSLQILRATAGEQAVVDEILKQLEKDLRKLLQSQSLTGAQKRQVEALIREADEIIEPAYSQIAKSFDARTLALIVAEKTVETMGDVFPVDVSMPTQERLDSLSRDVMIDGAPSSAWWERQAEDTKFKFGAEVRQGVINGETNERIVQRIVGKGGEPGIMEVQRRHARTLVHSSVMTAANEARLATFRKNKRLISGVRWLSTLDSHTCIICAALDGKGWDLDGAPLKGTKVAFEAPPKHFSCFPGHTLVSSRREITGASKRWFDGEVVVIKTASGRELTSTPNHPILTDRGWVAAGLLDVGGNVVCDSGSERGAFADGNSEDVPTSIHHVAETFLAARQVSAVPVKVSPEDFHGDGGGSHVAIIWSDRLLQSELYPLCGQHRGEVGLVDRGSAGLVTLAAGSGTTQGLETAFSSSHGLVGFGGLPLSLLGSHPAHSGVLLSAGTSQGYAVAPEDGQHDHPGNVETIADASSADAFAIQFDDFILSGPSLPQGRVDSSVDLSSQFASCLQQNAVYGISTGTVTAPYFDAALSAIVGGHDIIGGQITSYMAPHNDPAPLQLGGNGGVGASDLASDFDGGATGEILLDEIVNIDVKAFSGHVYNLETSGGWYIAEGIVVHNCRCILSPIPKTFKDLGLNIPEPKLAPVRASSDGPTDATSFDEFLKRQSPAFVDEVLGKERAAMFRARKITLSDLISGTGRELSLDELRERM